MRYLLPFHSSFLSFPPSLSFIASFFVFIHPTFYFSSTLCFYLYAYRSINLFSLCLYNLLYLVTKWNNMQEFNLIDHYEVFVLTLLGNTGELSLNFSVWSDSIGNLILHSFPAVLRNLFSAAFVVL
jgi:hypothetical protein